MPRRRKKRISREPFELEIEKFSHDGRGIGYCEGKAVFVDNALPDEKVIAERIDRHAKFDEAKTLEVLTQSPKRVEPPCQYFSLCGGCTMQHLNPEEQLHYKQHVLMEQLEHFGQTQVEQVLPPLRKNQLGYRRKARLGVKYVEKKGKVIVGFREKRSSFLADIEDCAVLHPRIASLIKPLQEFIFTLDARNKTPQLEVAVSGEERLAIVVRHLEALSENDLSAWQAFAKTHDFDLYLQPKGPASVHKIWPESGEERLYYTHEQFNVKLAFHPMDFTQVNQEINEAMVPLAIELLDLKPDENVLDLFCGLGNFTIPLATRAKHVIGVEGDERMVERGTENANANQLENVAFHAADLTKDLTDQAWASEGFDKILIDPPRSGAKEIIEKLVPFGAKKIVYVSCNPATLARDAGLLKDLGYTLKTVGIMDMFPHTSHVESIAVFDKS